jgi:hypothetical protein
VTTTNNPHIVATIADDVAVTGARVLWSTTAPANPKQPDLNALKPIAMARQNGTPKSGTYEAVIPNPVVGTPAGTTKTIYYLIEASDDDPPAGCAHRAYSPPSGIYSFTVKRP